MKKIISVLLSAVMVISCAAMPVMADYTASDYDVERKNLTYDSGTETNTIDNSAALALTSEQKIIEFEENSSMFTNEFYLSFDFRYDTASDSTVPGYMGITRKGKTGPLFSYSDGQLRTQTGSSSYLKLGAISPDVWYTAELEGKMTVVGANVNFNLYEYKDGVKTLVKNTPSLNLRNFYGGTSHGIPNYMYASNISIDNVYFVSEYPDELILSAVSEEINAGSTTSLDYTAKRQGAEITKHSATWSVYNEANTEEITDGSVTIDKDGILSADISALDQTVTVRATAAFESGNLIGTKQIKINAVKTDNEKFDTVNISGSTSVKAGTQAQYTFTASKEGADVTSTLTKEDVVWSVYDYHNLKPNNNRAISIENGVLKIEDGIIPQDITIRASSQSGLVYGSLTVKTQWSDSQKETVLLADACEAAPDGAEVTQSWDGSMAYTTPTVNIKPFEFGDKAEYVLTELDVKFTAEGSGITLIRKDGTENSNIKLHNGNIAQQTGSSAWSTLMSADTDVWYHLEILYMGGDNGDASCRISAYNADGTLGEATAFTSFNRRNRKNYGNIRVELNTIVDNVKVSIPVPDAISISPQLNSMFAGSENQISASFTRNNLPLLSEYDVQWFAIDENNEEITGETITISETGLLSVGALAPTQTIKVEAIGPGGIKDVVAINIVTSDSFKITNIGVSEDKTKIVKLYFEKNLYYEDDVAFILAIKSADGALKGIRMIKSSASEYDMGENEITLNYTLPSDFNAETDTIEALVWTTVD